MPRPPKAKFAAKDSCARLGVEARIWPGFQPPYIARRFDELTAPLMAKIKANSTECRILAATRDLLLQKMLNGEIRVWIA